VTKFTNLTLKKPKIYGVKKDTSNKFEPKKSNKTQHLKKEPEYRWNLEPIEWELPELDWEVLEWGGVSKIRHEKK